jgi:enoyl-CoA hydratase/carnithine racemase
MLLVDLADPPPIPPAGVPGVVVAVGESGTPESEFWLDTATFALADREHEDRRFVAVDSIADTVAELEQRCRRWPHASAVCDDVLRAVDVDGPAFPAIVTESLAYSTLQSGPEFARWLVERGPKQVPAIPDPVVAERTGSTLHIRFNRAQRHNAFSTDARALLLEALTVALLDDTVDEVVFGGNGPSFCSGGDLAEFGTFDDPASAHLARTRHSPALALDELTRRLGRACRAEIHGQVLGSGLEMAAFCGWVACHPDAVLGLPELALGLLPGAGGTLSITRRIGRWRTAYLVLSGRTIEPVTALNWGLVDEISA